jgi:hypothetical protein
MDDWPFEDPPNTAALTTRDILEGTAPILRARYGNGGRPDGATLRTTA